MNPGFLSCNTVWMKILVFWRIQSSITFLINFSMFQAFRWWHANEIYWERRKKREETGERGERTCSQYFSFARHRLNAWNRINYFKSCPIFVKFSVRAIVLHVFHWLLCFFVIRWSHDSYSVQQCPQVTSIAGSRFAWWVRLMALLSLWC